MNFSYGIIGIVGVLAAISIGFISMEPNDIIEPRAIIPEEKPTACTLQWDPMCGVDGETYGNMCQLDAAGAKLDYQGECSPEPVAESEPTMELPINDAVEEPVVEEPVVEEPVVEEPVVEEPVVEEPVVEEPVVEPTLEPEAQSLPSTAIVSIPAGSAVPGCEETNECYLPNEITVSTGTTVSWINDDSAAHTVTSGTVTAGVTGVFDSSLFMAGDVYEFTFNEAGTFDYFCMVHPWMTGVVNVN